MDELVIKLRKVCEAVVKSDTMLPRDGKTFCNLACQLICLHMGYKKFEGLLANQIYEVCSKEWKKVDPKWAMEYAVGGGLAIAALRGSPHGHVAMLVPETTMMYSGKWKQDCPFVANVGKRNGIMGSNWAFEKIPDYFICPKELIAPEEPKAVRPVPETEA